MKTFLALYMGAPETAQTRGPPDAATIGRGMAAWSAWMESNAARIVDTGGPLGATKAVGPGGIGDTRNGVAGYVLVKADRHDEAARLFQDHPHFAIFPGDRVEIMEVMPIPAR